MRHQGRHRHRLKHARRDTTQYALLPARMTMAAHYHQIETVVGRGPGQGSGTAPRRGAQPRGGCHAIPATLLARADEAIE
jgi:hypothetical protein